jgi:RNA polymerase sigma-70 factor, ECF subfamily
MTHVDGTIHDTMSSPGDQPAPSAGQARRVTARVERLYVCHGALVRSVCGSLLRDRVEAEDAAQQTFLSAQRALVNGSSPHDEAAWLVTIAKNESLSRVRARMREPLPLEIEEHGAAPDAHAAAVHRHDAGSLRDALAELPVQQREAILLREVRGLSYREVASALSVTTSAVESLLFRARRSLQTRLQESLAAFSAGAWVQPLRELVARIVGGGLAAPLAAKMAALGVGTAVVTGGALMGPRMLWFNPAPDSALRASRPSGHRVTRDVASQLPVTLPPQPAPRPAREPASSRPRDSGEPGSRSEISDRQTASGVREQERSTDTTTAERSTTSGSTLESGDSGTTQQAAPGTTSGSWSGTTGDFPTSTTDFGASEGSLSGAPDD